MITCLMVAVMVAAADTGQVKAERNVWVYAAGGLNHVNYATAGINPMNYAPGGINRHSSETFPPDRWFGEDKVKHFAMSYMITVGGYSGARFVAGHNESMMIGAGIALAAGIAKEIYDRNHNGTPSFRDLLWDAAGIATGVILAAQTR